MLDDAEITYVPPEKLRQFSQKCLAAAGVSETDAGIVADVLLAADLRGKESHGIARLRRYVKGSASGEINAKAVPQIIGETAGTATLDAQNGLGQPAGVKAMEIAVSKAKKTGVAAVTVKNTNHFGIAGYYSLLACRSGMIGIAMTNASPQVAPTFGAEPMFGTNPIAVAIPLRDAPPFSFDMATSTAPRGKLERMSWYGEPMPQGWAIDPDGCETTDTVNLIKGLKAHSGHALLPLGGAGELHGGHKGFGLGLLVDLLCGPLTGSKWGKRVYDASGAQLGHFFIALDIEAFLPYSVFDENAKTLLQDLRTAKKAKGKERIYIPGEKSAEKLKERTRMGVPVTPAVMEDISSLGRDYGVSL